MIENKILEKVRDSIFEEKCPVLQTKFKDLDIVLGGVEKPCLITIGARPAMGKTSFITTILLNLLEQNKKCLYFSLESSINQLIKRLAIQIAEVDANILYSGDILADRKKDQEKIIMAIEKLSKYNLEINDSNKNVENIKKHIEQYKPEFVFIDYLQLMDVSAKKPRSESFEKVMQDLKQIAKENDCIILITSQLSRAVEGRYDKRPILSDLKESGAIENVSDVVMFIYRGEYYSCCYKDSEECAWERGKADIIVAKNKYGPVGTVTLLFRSSIMKFLEPVHYDAF